MSGLAASRKLMWIKPKLVSMYLSLDLSDRHFLCIAIRAT